MDAALQHSHHHDAGGGGGGGRQGEIGGATCPLDTHEKYQRIIDELKNELEQMSCEVTQVKRECCSKAKAACSEDVALNLTESLKQLELQNDRLQEALKQQSEAKEAAASEMETQVGDMNCLQRKNI